MTATQTELPLPAPEERVSLNVKLFEELLRREFERGREEGKASATSFYVREHFGTTTYIDIITAKSRRELARKVQERNIGHIDTGCGHDCSGQVCGRYATMLRAYKTGAEGWLAVVEVTTSYDV